MLSHQNTSTSTGSTSANFTIFCLTFFGLVGSSLLLISGSPFVGLIGLFLTAVGVITLAHALPSPPAVKESEMSWESLERQLAELVEYPSTFGDKQSMLAQVRRVAKSGQPVKNPETIVLLLCLTESASTDIGSQLNGRCHSQAHTCARNAIGRAHAYVADRNNDKDQDETTADDVKLLAQ